MVRTKRIFRRDYWRKRNLLPELCGGVTFFMCNAGQNINAFIELPIAKMFAEHCKALVFCVATTDLNQIEPPYRQVQWHNRYFRNLRQILPAGAKLASRSILQTRLEEG